MAPIDLLVIGAGLHGLAIAKTYAESVPGCSILIVDSAASIGGVWARERLYPGLKTNNVVGSYEFSDFPMTLKRYGLEPGQHIPGLVVHQYLVDFARHFDLARRVKLKTSVDAATLGGDGIWRVECTSGGAQESLMALNVAVATGLTSEPNIPNFNGKETFKGNLFHSIDLKLRADDLRNAKGHVVVVGANKSAWDVCYTAATASPEATVHMLIRRSGRGPSWMWRRKGLLNNLSISRLTSTRVFTWFDPSPMATPLQAMFLASWLGRLLSAVFWTLLDYIVLWTSGYLQAEAGLQPLRPWSTTFWMGNSLSVHNYETDWFELAKQGRIIVHHTEIESFEGNRVHLSDGQVIEDVNTTVACTGWKYASNIRFNPPMAISGCVDDKTSMERSRALEHIGRVCPTLLARNKGKQYLPPHRLYRFIAPLDPRLRQFHNIIFIGFYESVQTALVAQAQAVWGTAYLLHAMADVDQQACRQWTLLNTEYQQLRRLGSPFPDLVLDALPYIDLLLTDAGVPCSRKRGWWRNLLGQHTPADYQGLSIDLARMRSPQKHASQ